MITIKNSQRKIKVDMPALKRALQKMLDYGLLAGAPRTLDGESKLEGSGNSWGFNMGLIYRASQRHGLAATFPALALVLIPSALAMVLLAVITERGTKAQASETSGSGY